MPERRSRAFPSRTLPAGDPLRAGDVGRAGIVEIAEAGRSRKPFPVSWMAWCPVGRRSESGPYPCWPCGRVRPVGRRTGGRATSFMMLSPLAGLSRRYRRLAGAVNPGRWWWLSALGGPSGEALAPCHAVLRDLCAWVFVDEENPASVAIPKGGCSGRHDLPTQVSGFKMPEPGDGFPLSRE